MIDRASQIARARSLLAGIVHSGFFGEVTFKLEHGNIVYVELIENQRLSSDEVLQFVQRAEPGTEINVRPATRRADEHVVLASAKRSGNLEQVCKKYESPRS